MSFSDLPPETQYHILSFITSDHHRRAYRLVSKIWSEFINYSEFKIGLLLDTETDEFIRYFSQYEKPIGLKFTKTAHFITSAYQKPFSNPNLIREDQLLRAIENLTQLTSLELHLDAFKVPKRLTNLQHLSILYSMETKEDSESLLFSLPHLTSLSVPTFHLGTKFPPNLEKLSCDMIEFQAERTLEQNTRLTSLQGIFDKTLIRALPNLRQLDIKSSYIILNKDTPNLIPYLEDLCTSTFQPEWEFKHLTQLDIIAIGSPPPVKLTSKLAKLKVLKCHELDLEDCDMNIMKSLESCVIRDDDCNMKVLPKLNSEKITQLTIKATEDNFVDFAKFTNLVSLKMTLPGKSGPHPVPLTSLTKLILYYNAYPAKWMNGLQNLQDLSISPILNTRNFNELLDFEELQKLTVLRMRGSYDRIYVKNLTNLIQLEIESGPSQKNPPTLDIYGLSTLTNLTRLAFMSGSSYKALKNWTDLASLTNLRDLYLGAEQERGDGTNLAPLTNLTRLDYSTSDVRSLECLTKLSRLQILRVQGDQAKYIRQNIFPELPFCYDCVAFPEYKKERDPIK